MNKITMDQLPEELLTKVEAVAKARRHIVRRVTTEEAAQIHSLDAWRQGYFVDHSGAQVVLNQRDCGQHVLYKIGYSTCIR